MDQDDELRIKKLRDKYHDGDNVALIDEWENKLKSLPTRKEYLNMDMTKGLIAFLRTRITDMMKIKAFSETLVPDELKLLNARIKECKNVLSFLSPNIEREIESLRIEADKAIEQESLT